MTEQQTHNSKENLSIESPFAVGHTAHIDSCLHNTFRYVWVHDHMMPSSQLDSQVQMWAPEQYEQWCLDRHHFL